MIRFILAGLKKKFDAMGIPTYITKGNLKEDSYPLLVIETVGERNLIGSRDTLRTAIQNEDDFDIYEESGERITQVRFKIYAKSVSDALKYNKKVLREINRETIYLNLKNLEIDLTVSEKQSLFEINSVVDDIFEMETFYEDEDSFTYVDSGKAVWCYIQNISVTYTEIPRKVKTVSGVSLTPEIEMK